MSMQVLKLEDNIKDLKAKLTEALSDKRDTIQVSNIILIFSTMPGAYNIIIYVLEVSVVYLLIFCIGESRSAECPGPGVGG